MSGRDPTPGLEESPHANARRIADEMAEAGIRIVCILPETWLAALYEILAEDDRFLLVPVAKEEEGIGIMAGAFFGGVPAALLMSNSGFMTCMCALNGLAMRSGIPMLLMIVQRGELDETEVLQGNIAVPTVRVIEALDMRHFTMEAIEDAPMVGRAWRLGYVLRQPVCLLLGRDALLGRGASPYWYSEAYQRASLSSEGDR